MSKSRIMVPTPHLLVHGIDSLPADVDDIIEELKKWDRTFTCIFNSNSGFFEFAKYVSYNKDPVCVMQITDDEGNPTSPTMEHYRRLRESDIRTVGGTWDDYQTAKDKVEAQKEKEKDAYLDRLWEENLEAFDHVVNKDSKISLYIPDHIKRKNNITEVKTNE